MSTQNSHHFAGSEHDSSPEHGWSIQDATLSKSILWQMAIMDELWTISWVSSLCLLAIWFLWQIWHWQSCNTSALLLAFGSLTHYDTFGCSIQSATENWSREEIDSFRDFSKPGSNCLYKGMHVQALLNVCVRACVYNMNANKCIKCSVNVRTFWTIHKYACAYVCICRQITVCVWDGLFSTFNTVN